MPFGYDSGIFPSDDPGSKIERCARFAYHLAKIDPDVAVPAGTSRIWCGMLGPDLARDGIRHVDVGVAPGRAFLEFGWRSAQAEEGPVRAVILGRQGRSAMTFACAHASAQLVAWSRSEVWPESFVLECAKAIVLPAVALQFAKVNVGDDPLAIAELFATDAELVLDRMATLRGAKRSSERPAMRLAGDGE